MNDVAIKQNTLQLVDAEQDARVTTPLVIIERAIQNGASIETLERLLALQERYEAAQARREFDEAMSEAKAEIKPIIKNKKVGFESKRTDSRTDYDYEDLAAVAGEVDPILTRHGLSYRYSSRQDGTMVSVTCIIAHRRGHREETTLQAASDTSGNKNHVQAIGSTTTYLQRYTLKLALGLSAAKDMDGAISSDEGPKIIDDAQFRYISDLIEKSGSDEAKLLTFLKAESLETLTQAQYRQGEAALRKKIASATAKPEVK